jgi:2-dehydropantoate 2-reductase
METSSAPRVLVMGCGGIGGIIAAGLRDQGIDTTIVTHNPAIADAITHAGLVIRDGATVRTVRAGATPVLPPDCGTFDFVFLTTQPPQVVTAARAAAAALRPDGAMVCFQNGLCEPYVEEIVGANRVLGAVVVWGASMAAPGVYDRTSAGGFVIGRMDGAHDPRFPRLQALLAGVGPVEITHNLCGARWSKLAINCAITSLGTIGGDRLGELMRHRFVRRLGLEVMSEAVAVARRTGVRLEKVSGTLDLNWIALTPADVSGPGSPTLVAKHALLLAVGAKYRRLRSSMLIGIERGREPAIDFLNGEVVRRGRALDVPVPVNERVQNLIGAIWRRERRPGLEVLRALYRESRGAVYAATAAGYRPNPVPPP